MFHHMKSSRIVLGSLVVVSAGIGLYLWLSERKRHQLPEGEAQRRDQAQLLSKLVSAAEMISLVQTGDKDADDSFTATQQEVLEIVRNMGEMPEQFSLEHRIEAARVGFKLVSLLKRLVV